MNFKKFFSLICLSVCFLFAFAEDIDEDIDIESLYRSSALPTGNALLATAANGTVKTATELQSSTFWNTTMGWSISTSGDKGNPWLIPSNSKALPYQRTGNETYAPFSIEVSISSKDELLALCGAYKPYKVTLKQNIDLGGDTLYSLNSIKVFDGGNFTISNFVLKNHPTSSAVGVFTSIDTVQNLTVKIKSVDVNTYSSLGVLVGHLPSGGLIKNCHVLSNAGTVTVAGKDSVGGLVGFSEGKIVKSSVKGINVIASLARAGGLVGYCAVASEIDSCEVESSTISAIGWAGGIAGTNLGTCKNSRVTHATLTANYNIGGIAGENGANLLSNNRVDSTQISSTGSPGLSLGGIVGFCSGTPDIKDCKVDSVSLTATGGKYIGGIVGYSKANVSLCSASRITISGKDSLGGLVGAGFAGRIDSNIVRTVAITGTGNSIGGLVGGNNIISLTYDTVYNVTISATNHAGGLVGYSGNINSIINNCKVDTCKITAIYDYVGGIAGTNLGTCKNSRVTHANLTARYNIGGIAGENGTGLLSNNMVDSTQISSTGSPGLSLGGIVGLNSTNFTLRDCKVDSVSFSSTGSGINYVGGIVGYSNANISLCSASRIKISGKEYLGGLVGIAKTGRIDTNTVINSEIIGNSGNSVGGLVGGSSCDLTYDTVYNVTVSGNDSVGGLVGVSRGKITNSFVRQARVTSSKRVGGLVAYSYKEIDGCRVDSSNITSSTLYVGGIVGSNYESCKNSTVSHVTLIGIQNIGGIAGENGGSELSGNRVDSTNIRAITNTTYTTAFSLGGIVGYNWGTSTIRDCKVDSVSFSSNGDAYNVGGIVGNSKANISLCSASRIKISGKWALGGLVGLAESGKIDTSTVINSSITGTGDRVGGLVGENKVAISYSKVDSATVKGANNSGGLVGYVSGTSTLVSDTVINSKITATVYHAGGLVGCDASDGLVAVNNCRTSLDSVSGTSNVGGFVGTLNGTITGGFVDSMVIISSSTTDSRVGGIVGYGAQIATAITGVSARHISVTASGPNAGGIAGYTLGSVTSSKVDTSSINGTGSVGGVVGLLVGTVPSISSCSIDSVRVFGSVHIVGGIVGCNEGNLLNDTVNNSIITSGTNASKTGGYLGGISGHNKANIVSCVVRGGSVDLYLAEGAAVGCGGIAGFNDDNNYVQESMVLGTKVTLTSATIEGDGIGCGGIVGRNEGVVSKSLASSVTVKHSREGNGTLLASGGIAGYSKGGSITQCLVKDDTIDGQCYIGGVVGCVWDADISINNCHVHNTVISSSNTTDNTHMGGIVGKHRGTVENCLVTNIIIRNYNTDKAKVAIGGILGVKSGVSNVKNNIAMIDYFDIRAKVTKDGGNFGRIFAGTPDNPTGNLGWVETYVKYYHKKFGLNWYDNFYLGTGRMGNTLRNGENLFVGDICATAGYSSNTSTTWNTLNFSSDYWNFDYLASNKFAVLKIFKDSTYALLVANRGNEYMEKVKASGFTDVSTEFNVPIKIFSPRAFTFGYNTNGSYFLYISANKVDLYTDILLEEDNNSGNSTFWAVDLNIGNSGNIQQPLIYQTNPSSFELDGHGYSIEGYYNPHIGEGYAKSSLINDIAGCAYTVKRLEVDSFTRICNLATSTEQIKFGALIDKVSGASIFEDIYIKNPKIQVTDVNYTSYIGGLVGEVSNNITANRLVVYMTATAPLKAYVGDLGGFFGEVSSSGAVVFNNVASYSEQPYSAGGGNHGYYIGKGAGSYTDFWFGKADLGWNTSNSVPPTRTCSTTGTIFDALTGASITNGTVWHIPASTVSTDSIYLVRDTIADGDWSGL